MTSLMRQSRNLAYLSLRSATQSSLRTSSRSILSSTRILAQQCRSYATEPKKDKKSTSKAPGRPSKPAPGTENLYNDKTAMTPSSDGKEPSSTPETNYVKITEEEESTLRDILATMKTGLPEADRQRLEAAFENIKKEGIPQELREIMTEKASGQTMTAATAAKLVRLATQMSKKIEGRDFNSDKKSDSIFNDAPAPDTKQSSGNKSQGGTGSNPNVSEVKLDLNTALLSTFVLWLVYRMLIPGDSSRDISWQEFRTTFLDKGLVDKLTVVNKDHVRVDLHREQTANMYPDSPASNPNFHYYFTIGSIEAFEKRLDDAQSELQIPSHERIPVSYASEGSLMKILFEFGPTLLFIGFLVFTTRSLKGGAGGGGANSVFSMGKSRAKKFNHETDIKVKFKDVAGMDEAKQEIMEFVSFLKTPGQYQRLGAKIPRGAILSGPPGTGKTLLAKATAGESQVPFFSVSGSEFVEMFVGVGPSRVRDLFKEARKNTPCIIFIDEIDAIGKSRSKGGNFGGGNDERESTLNQILTEMDGFNTTEQVVVLAGTNRPDILDSALMRPGRFDRHIAIDKPTMDGRKQIFKVHMGKIVTSGDVEHLTGRLSALTPGFSGADIANCVNEAALIAARTSAASVTMQHFEQAIERVIGGLEKKSLVLSPEDKRTVAYHEAGHAICGWYFKYADPLLKVSIIPRGQGALGYAQYLPASDTYLMNVHQLMDRMAMTLGGRISEELHFDTVTSGASDDFNKVTRLATAMVTKWGMSKKLGPLHFEDDDNKFNKPFAESTAQTIDAEVRRIVDEAYKQCQDLLTEKKKEVGIVAEELLAKEVLGREDMIRLLGKRPFDDNKDFTKYFGGGTTEAGQAIAPKGGVKGDAAPPPMETDPGNSGGTGPTPALYKRWSDM